MRKLALIVAAVAALAGCVHHPHYNDYGNRYDRGYYGYRYNDYGNYYDRSHHRHDRKRYDWDRYDRHYRDDWRWD
jgi:hypothetical protein